MEYQQARLRLEHHQLAVVLALITAFLIAFLLMFIHPTASLAVFAIALIGLVAAVIVGFALKRAKQTAAREELAHQACPECGAKVVHPAEHPADWHCPGCGADFTPRGAEIV